MCCVFVVIFLYIGHDTLFMSFVHNIFICLSVCIYGLWNIIIDIRDTVIWSNKYKLLYDTVVGLGINMFRVNSHTRLLLFDRVLVLHHSYSFYYELNVFLYDFSLPQKLTI